MQSGSKTTILVLGATGRCGSAIVKRALAASEGKSKRYDVRVYVRNAEKASKVFPSQPNLEIIQGAIGDVATLKSAMEGVDAVLSGLASFASPHNQMSTAVENVIKAAEALKRPTLRYIHYGLCGLRDPDADMKTMRFINNLFSPSKFGPAMEDHRKVLRLLKTSSLQWTVFMTAMMQYDRPIGTPYIVGSPEVVPQARLYHRIGVLDAADACLGVLEENGPEFLHLAYK